jgi:hypothetical protein
VSVDLERRPCGQASAGPRGEHSPSPGRPHVLTQIALSSDRRLGRHGDNVDHVRTSGPAWINRPLPYLTVLAPPAPAAEKGNCGVRSGSLG